MSFHSRGSNRLIPFNVYSCIAPIKKLFIDKAHSESYMQADVSGVFGLGAAGGDCLCDGGPGTGDTSVNLATVGYTYSFCSNKLYDATYGFTRMGHISQGR